MKFYMLQLHVVCGGKTASMALSATVERTGPQKRCVRAGPCEQGLEGKICEALNARAEGSSSGVNWNFGLCQKLGECLQSIWNDGLLAPCANNNSLRDRLMACLHAEPYLDIAATCQRGRHLFFPGELGGGGGGMIACLHILDAFI
eukprot:jgi/Botrbrau1/15200/Bobra.0149s0060.1